MTITNNDSLIRWRTIVGEEMTLKDGGYIGDLMNIVRLHLEKAKDDGQLTNSEMGQIYATVIPAIFDKGMNYAMTEQIEKYKTDIEELNVKVAEYARDKAQFERDAAEVEKNIALSAVYTTSKERVLAAEGEAAEGKARAATKEAELVEEKINAEKEKNGGVEWETKYKGEYTTYDGTLVEVGSDKIGTTISSGPVTFYKYRDAKGVWSETYNTQPDAETTEICNYIMYQHPTEFTFHTTQVPYIQYKESTGHFDGEDNSVFDGTSLLLISDAKYMIAKAGETTLRQVGIEVGWWNDLVTEITTVDKFFATKREWDKDPDVARFGGDGSKGSGKITVFYETILVASDNGKEVQVKIDTPYTQEYKYLVETGSTVESSTPKAGSTGKSLYYWQKEEVKQKQNLYKRQRAGFDEQRADKLTKMAMDLQSINLSKGNLKGAGGLTLGSLKPKTDAGYTNLYRTMLDQTFNIAGNGNSPAAIRKNTTIRFTE